MLYRLLAYWISFVFPTFYKRIQIKNAHWLQVTSPAIIAINHPNAFTDPVGLCYIMYPRRFWFLARGDVFKPGLVSRLLDSIGIIPIYRMMDSGKEGLTKNDQTYQKVNSHLKNREKVIVFAEGICIMERRLRPLKKGVARMVFGAYEFLNKEDLLVIPVGVNYSQPDKFRSTLFFNVGEPISISEFLKGKNEAQVKLQSAFLQHLEPRLRKLITHIKNPSNDCLVVQTEALFKKDIIHSRKMNPNDLADDFEILQEITEKINRADEENPELLNEFRIKTDQYFQKLKNHRLRDWLICPFEKRQIGVLPLTARFLLLLMLLPMFLCGYLLNILPHRFTFFLTNKLVKNREFYSSFAIAFALPVFLIYYSILFILSWTLSGGPWISMVLITISMLLGWFQFFYKDFALKTFGVLRILINKPLLLSLSSERNELLGLFNKF